MCLLHALNEIYNDITFVIEKSFFNKKAANRIIE